MFELKFRLYDGTDIGPIEFSPAATVAVLQQTVFSQWPRGKTMAPTTARDIKLISAGQVLWNNLTVEQCRARLSHLQSSVITMHVVVQPPLRKRNNGGNLNKNLNTCACTIM